MSDPGKGSKAAKRATVRMYRQGLGDCFLITFFRDDQTPVRVMIDCGVILGTEAPGTKMMPVMDDIVRESKGQIDVLVVTHQHWDHLSGFVQANEAFERLTIKKLWLAWTEEPGNELAERLGKTLDSMKKALRVTGTAMHMAGDGSGVEDIGGLLDFFGAAGNSTIDALDIVKAKAKADKAEVHYWRPKEHKDLFPGVRVYALGPPEDEKALRKTLPSKKTPETYGLADFAETAAIGSAFESDDNDTPFDEQHLIPWVTAQGMEFYQRYYWGPGGEAPEWRRIDGDWLGAAADLALALDSATNNTSLVLAFEFDNTKKDVEAGKKAAGDVLLFVADAQVGNWLSWENLTWTPGGRNVTTDDLLKRTIFYKVGHHGSHNATLRDKGLERMTGLKYAAIPVNHEMAVRKRWGNMPLPELIEALRAKNVTVVRIDEEPAEHPHISATELYIEISV